MIVSTISFWLPLLWAIGVALYWRFTVKVPVNHWLVCLLIGAISFFWFATAVIVVILGLILKYKVFSSNKKDESTE